MKIPKEKLRSTLINLGALIIAFIVLVILVKGNLISSYIQGIIVLLSLIHI